VRDTYTEMAQRVDDVTELYGEYASLHEAFSVLLEEVGELGQEVYARERNIGRIRAEAMDVAVVCARILREWPLVREGTIEAVRVGV
jgi:NTP pyrophosphatase (non-canonical NTP hydrolase)